jgi:hypothetical protein
MTRSNWSTARSVLNSFDAGTPPWKGCDSPVSVVPGCSATQTRLRLRRASSIERVRMNMFCAAFAPR